MIMKLKDVATIKFCLLAKQHYDKANKLVMPSKLLENNVIEDYDLNNEIKVDDSMMIYPNDIIIKRISPSYINYIDEIDDNVYAAGNLIIVRATQVDPKYLAYILDKNISRITNLLAGARVPAIGRDVLEDIQVPMLTNAKQQMIGELWYKGIKKYNLEQRLIELQKTRTKALLDEFVLNNNGGR